MAIVLDIHESHFNKHGEELCGDTVKIHRSPEQTIIVLSDGLGSGVKANILSTLTAEIITTMLAEHAPLQEVIRTVIGTLPMCKVRELAYATFTVVQIQQPSGRFHVVNFDNPRIIWLKKGKLLVPERQFQTVLDRKIAVFDGQLEEGDFLGILSDGVLHAGVGVTMNLGWGWENVSHFAQWAADRWSLSSERIVKEIMGQTWSLYQGHTGDDATLVGIGVRPMRMLTLFTGPPLNQADDTKIVEKFLRSDGRKAICGGTTGNIVADYLGEVPEVDISTMREKIPPLAMLREVDLLTEGILTMSSALEMLKASMNADALPDDPNAATRLAREIIQADRIHFLVGQRINEYYQNPDLPLNISLRKSLVNEYLQLLQNAGKDVSVEYF